jgi:outer membrane murein-binding lipoprotein Lpp
MSFSVEGFHDLLRLLEARPEWRAELRRVVLTEDLLRLPEQLAQARLETERRFQELAARLDTLTARVDGLAEQVGALTARLDTLAMRMDALTTRVDSLITQVSTLAGHVGTLRGESLEHRYRTRGFAYFGRVLRRAHVLSPDELSTMLEDAIQGAGLSVEDAHEIALADVVVRGKRPTDGSTVYLVLEVSVGVGLDDVQRARSRAELLARTGVTAVPAVAGEWVVPDAADAARALRVWQITDGRVVAPDAPRT